MKICYVTFTQQISINYIDEQEEDEEKEKEEEEVARLEVKNDPP